MKSIYAVPRDWKVRRATVILHFSLYLISPTLIGCAEPRTANGITEHPHACTDREVAILVHSARPLYKKEIMRLVHAVTPWPDETGPYYAAADYERLVEVAARLQTEEKEIVSFALDDYIQHYDTAFDPNIKPPREWSRVLLLLLVMFEIPDAGRSADEWQKGPMLAMGFSYSPASGEKVVLTPCSPISWTEGQPRLLLRRGGFNGPAPSAGKVFWTLSDQYGYRKGIGGKRGGVPLTSSRTVEETNEK